MKKLRINQMILEALKEVKNVSTMRNSDFSRIIPEDTLPTKESEVNSFVKNRIRLWIRTWIYDELRYIIDKIEGRK